MGSKQGDKLQSQKILNATLARCHSEIEIDDQVAVLVHPDASLRVDVVRTEVAWDDADLNRFLARCGFRPGQFLVPSKPISRFPPKPRVVPGRALDLSVSGASKSLSTDVRMRCGQR